MPENIFAERKVLIERAASFVVNYPKERRAAAAARLCGKAAAGMERRSGRRRLYGN